VAGFAAYRLSRSAYTQHAVAELSLVRVRVTSGAGAVLEVIHHRRLHCRPAGEIGLRLMAFVAGCGDMPAAQAKARLLVPCQGEGGRPVSAQVVALLALVKVRSSGELALVFVLVAVGALRKTHLVNRGSARGNVALLASYGRVLALQRIRGGGMLFYSEQRRPEAVYFVAGRALAPVGAMHKLPLVRVPVAIGTLLEGDRLLEIATAMAPVAAHIGMLPQQRELGP